MPRRLPSNKFAYDIKEEHAIIMEKRSTEMLELYDTGKYSLRAIGKLFGLHPSTVAARIKTRRKI